MSAGAFAALHHAERLLVLPNAWDALSAALVAAAGACAIATTSAGVAWSDGFADGEHASLEDQCRAVGRIASVARVPITVDLERGYSDEPDAVAAAVERIIQAGACGVNLEDAAEDPALLAAKIRAVKRRLGDRVFVNARTCLLLRGEGSLDDVVARVVAYEAAGADGVFVPRLVEPAAITRVVAATDLPLNVLLDPRLPAQDELLRLGVRRLSAGPFLALEAYAAAKSSAVALLGGELVGATVKTGLAYPEANALLAAASAVRASTTDGSRSQSRGSFVLFSSR